MPIVYNPTMYYSTGALNDTSMSSEGQLLFLIVLSAVLLAGIFVFVTFVIHYKREEKQEKSKRLV